MIRNIFKAIAGFFGFKNKPVKATEYEEPERAPKAKSKRTRKPKMRGHDYTMR